MIRYLIRAIVSRLTVGLHGWRWRAPVPTAPSAIAEAPAPPPEPIPNIRCEVCDERLATRVAAWQSSAFIPPAIYVCEQCVYCIHRKSDWGVA